MDRLKAMNAFVRAVDLGSLSAAARELHTTQPTVSKLVAALEHSVGVRLLERASTRVAATDEGLRFLDSARRLLEDYQEAVGELTQRTREPRGLVRISAPVALGELRLNRLMLEAMARHPQLQVTLLLDDRFIDPVQERIDLAVRIGGALPPDRVALPLAVWPRWLVASPDYVKGRGEPRDPQALAQHGYLRYASPENTVTLDGPDGTARVELAARYRVNSAVAMLEAVRAGAGIALQPSWMVRDLLDAGSLVRILPRWSGPAQKAHLIHAPRSRQPMRVQAIQDLLLAAVPGW
ncbi:MAG: LysR family transcriptional regulator [Proteobacteria bacterium]|nr:LysR family transcriptional regulator [Pseudomonadota bacterium]